MIAHTNKVKILAYLLAVVGCFPIGTFGSVENPTKKETSPVKQERSAVGEPAPSPCWLYAGGNEAVLMTEQRYRIVGAPSENSRVLHPFNKALSNAEWIYSIDMTAVVDDNLDTPQIFPVAKAESCHCLAAYEKPLFQGGGAGGLPA